MKSHLKSEIKTLLLIDDEPDIIEMVFAMLQKPDLQLLLAKNGQEALEILRQRPVDAILSDIRMPNMSGVAMVQQIRNLGLATPIVLMSGFADYNAVLAALRVGVIDVIEKPFPKDRLVKAVDHAIELGSNVRRIHSDLKKFCDERKVDSKYVDIMKYLSIYLSQQEVDRVRREAMKAF